MPTLKWDETDFLECLEVAPEVEQHEVCHTYQVIRAGIGLKLQLWQYESILELTLTNEKDENVITSYAIMVKGEIKLKTFSGRDFLVLTNCLVLPNRFSYLDLGGIEKLEKCNIGYNISLRVNPSIHIEFLTENN
jgi:hypothetical protein